MRKITQKPKRGRKENPQQDTNNKTESKDKVPAKIKQADHYHTDF